MSTDSDYNRTTVSPSDNRGYLRRGLDTLQNTLSQSVETVTRKATLKATSGEVEDIDAPDNIEELYNLYETNPLIRSNIDQFTRDVTKPGVRVEAEDPATEAYFNGGEDAPESAPEGGFLEEAFVLQEKRRPFVMGLEMAVRNRWVRGTVLIEKLKAEEDEADSRLTGYRHIRPETVSARTYDYTNILVDPEDTEAVGQEEITERGEAAAWIQFDENAILSRRAGRDFSNRTSIPLSQNDVVLQTLDLNIGGSDPEDGVFGTSVLEAVKEDAEEYAEIKRDRATAIKRTAYGQWMLEFDEEALELGDEVHHRVWDEADQDAMVSELEDVGAGQIVFGDSPFTLKKFPQEVPDLDDTLKHYVNDIIAPLPAPKFATAHGEDVTQHVTEEQDARYEQRIKEERQYQERSWTQAFRDFAERHPDLESEGIKVKIRPEQGDSPIDKLDDTDVDKIASYMGAVADAYGPGGAAAYIDEEVINELILQLPEDSGLGGDAGVDDLGLDDLEQALDDGHEGVPADD